jgi:uncharacterized protein
MWKFLRSKALIIVAGLALGILASLLVKLGNPGNAGIAPTCFIRDIAGALGFHENVGFQYIRPEIIGLVLGSFIAAYSFGEFRSRGGSSPLFRFLLGAVLMIGALTFLGCPIRATLRLAGGDLNALAGIAGLATGIMVGVLFLKRGYDLSRASSQPIAAGWIMPLFMVGLLVLVIFKPSFITFSSQGFGSYHAAIGISLGAGLLIGFLAQRTRICFMGAWRDVFLIKNGHLMTAVIAAFLGAMILNLILGQFKLGFQNQPLAQTNQLWNFMGMVLVGLAAALLGGCPLRQLILTGQGDTDAGITVLGMFAGGALAPNFNISSCSGELAQWGPVAVMAGLAICVAIGFLSRPK